jgi:hypothetical protein
MQHFLYTCFLVLGLGFSSPVEKDKHPVFVTVTEIEQNVKEKSLEISCKIFTDDFEKALRAAFKTKVDLLDDKLKPAMDKLVSDYVQKHLKIVVDGKASVYKYIGYEKIEEAIYSYYEIENVTSVKKMSVTDDLLYEYKKEQMSLLHVTIAGKRQSTKLSNPEKLVNLNF